MKDKEWKKQDNFRTLSGKKTKDTLTIPEQEKLEKKKENDTLIDQPSLSSLRSTTGSFYEDKVKYNPNVEYFMLDYKRKDVFQWVRMGYMTQFDLLPYIRDFTENFIDYSGFRIHSEKELDMKMKVECEDGEYRELSLRQLLFGDKYEKFSDMVKDPNSPFLEDMWKSRNPEEEEEELETV